MVVFYYYGKTLIFFWNINFFLKNALGILVNNISKKKFYRKRKKKRINILTIFFHFP